MIPSRRAKLQSGVSFMSNSVGNFQRWSSWKSSRNTVKTGVFWRKCRCSNSLGWVSPRFLRGSGISSWASSIPRMWRQTPQAVHRLTAPYLRFHSSPGKASSPVRVCKKTHVRLFPYVFARYPGSDFPFLIQTFPPSHGVWNSFFISLQ